MAQAATASHAYTISPARTVEKLRSLLLWMTGFSGAFVFTEPSPYEIFAAAAIFFFFATGLSIRRGHLPLLAILIVYCFGATIAVIPVVAEPKTAMWVTISWFMAATALFYACVIAEDTERRLNILMSGYMAAAIVASLVAILAYFHAIPGADSFLLYGRAKGTFNDPNVIGPFLVLPGLLAIRRVLSFRLKDFVIGSAQVSIIVIALLLSFSRGAWGHFAASAAIFIGLLFVVSTDARERTRIIGATIAGVGLLALILIALLSMKGVGSLFTERATLEQSYDMGQLGRFGRHILGFELALDTPWGLGPFQFAKRFPEDPHNVYLNSFMTGGWLGGITYLLLVLMTLWAGIKGALRATPWRPVLLATWATFIGVVGEGAIIDTDHWRHFWLLAGVLWGGAVAASRYRVEIPRISPTKDPEPGLASLQRTDRITIVRPLSERGAARLAH
ncbi:MAG: O-antigen ligase domain-containing protein [Xanthobacteraceae bacterium]|nr:O-antigen ligase domain-containing protein [Xanthobacteraceae bacterium]MCW5677343.1 O-antigen ligase domain-containing protein [Xanthobacteraceae bacterium]